MAAPSPEKDNFVRIAALLMDGGTELLRSLLNSIHKTPVLLSTALADPITEGELKKAKISKDEWNKLYPPAGGQVMSEDLDITLLCKVLRHACSPPLTTPPGGWKTPPSAADQSPSDDLVRIRIHRNEVAHAAEMKLSTTEFVQIWDELSAAMIRLAKYISTSEETKCEALVKKYRYGPVTCEEGKYVKELVYWCDKDRLLEEEVRTGFQDLREGIAKEISSVRELSAATLDILVRGSSAIDRDGTRLQTPSADEIVRKLARLYLEVSPPQNNEDLLNYLSYLKEFRMTIGSIGVSSLRITVNCARLADLEELWQAYTSGALNEAAEKYLVTDEVLRQYNLTELRLKTVIDGEDYRRCKEQLRGEGNHLAIA